MEVKQILTWLSIFAGGITVFQFFKEQKNELKEGEVL